MLEASLGNIAAWALQVAAQIGFGGKCAFGLGRVRVQVERVGEP